MTLKFDLPRHVRIVDGLQGLAAVKRHGVNLALWPRALTARRISALQESASTGFDPVRFTAEAREVATQLGGRLPPRPIHTWLAQDAATLAHALASLASTQRIAIRVEAISGDACRYFHADTVALRLVTTYCGRGTQWLDDADADELRAGGDPPEDSRVREMAAGMVAVFKGMQPAIARPLVHRSPAWETARAARLFLAIDPVSGC